MQKSAIYQKLPPQILFILHQNTCFGPYFNMKYWFFREPTKNFSRRLILWISTQDGQNRHVDPMMVQKGPNGPETLLTCIIHNYRSYWPALGPFRYPRGAKRAISAQSLKLFGPNFGSQKNLRNIGIWGVQRVATECPVHILLLRTIWNHPAGEKSQKPIFSLKKSLLGGLTGPRTLWRDKIWSVLSLIGPIGSDTSISYAGATH